MKRISIKPKDLEKIKAIQANLHANQIAMQNFVNQINANNAGLLVAQRNAYFDLKNKYEILEGIEKYHIDFYTNQLTIADLPECNHD